MGSGTAGRSVYAASKYKINSSDIDCHQCKWYKFKIATWPQHYVLSLGNHLMLGETAGKGLGRDWEIFILPVNV